MEPVSFAWYNHLDLRPDGTGWAIGSARSGDQTKLAYTSDGGHGWRAVTGLPPGWPLFLRSFDDRVAYLGWRDPASGRATMYVTTDAGLTWTPQPLPAIDWTGGAVGAGGSDEVNAPVSFPTPRDGWLLDAPRVYRTHDSGLTWSQVSTLPSNLYPQTITFTPGGEGWVTYPAAAAAQVGVLHSTDGGATWTTDRLKPPLVGITLGFGAVVADAGGAALPAIDADGSMGVGAPASVYLYGRRPGAEWQGPLLVWQGKTALGGPVVVRPAAGTWWLVVGSEVAVSRDGGLTWTRHDIPIGILSGLAYDFVDGDRAYVATQAGCPEACRVRLITTADAGATWSDLPAPI